jgi:hypothetical protein
MRITTTFNLHKVMIESWTFLSRKNPATLLYVGSCASARRSDEAIVADAIAVQVGVFFGWASIRGPAVVWGAAVSVSVETTVRFAPWGPQACCEPGWPGATRQLESVKDFEAEFFDDGIGQDVFGDALDLAPSFVATHPIHFEDEEFSLTHILNL